MNSSMQHMLHQAACKCSNPFQNQWQIWNQIFGYLMQVVIEDCSEEAGPINGNHTSFSFPRGNLRNTSLVDGLQLQVPRRSPAMPLRHIKPCGGRANLTSLKCFAGLASPDLHILGACTSSSPSRWISACRAIADLEDKVRRDIVEYN